MGDQTPGRNGWRQVLRIVPASPTTDGAGVRLNRSIGGPALGELDPFLLLDEFHTENPDDYIAGFPDHPHRGFETVTYMIEGRMRHQDSAGHGGSLGPGGVQWMTAGRGIVHSEMPEQIDGRMQGFQLWVNLPARDKMRPPRYQNIDPDGIPELARDTGARIRVVAGTLEGVEGPVREIAVAPLYLDVRLPRGALEVIDTPEGHNGFVYVFEGDMEVGGAPGASPGDSRRVRRGELAVLSRGRRLALGAPGGAGTHGEARALVVAARPLGEPVARWGPFVMNTREEIVQAVEDFRRGAF